MSSRPYMKFFIGDFQADTMQLSNEEVGAYLRLLMVQWASATDSIPNDDRLLMRILHCTPKQLRRLKPTMLGFFKLQPDGCLKQGRVSFERLRVDRKASQLSANALKRWRRGDANASMLESDSISKEEILPRARARPHREKPNGRRKKTTSEVIIEALNLRRCQERKATGGDDGNEDD
jgi:uncharacterized protein YdaU (DUF1376 family)